MLQCCSLATITLRGCSRIQSLEETLKGRSNTRGSEEHGQWPSPYLPVGHCTLQYSNYRRVPLKYSE